MAIKKLISDTPGQYSGGSIREDDTERPIQTGALPWRVAPKKGFQVLLVTGRRSRRWTIPKGWPINGKSLAEAAEVEAFEEAGVTGKVDPRPLGSFDHTKQHLPSGTLDVSILVHPMCVERQLSKWPEFGQRRRKWFSVKEAVKRVDSEQLGALIVQSAKRMTGEKPI
jgi:8-oxo-dGTP pyrophosphatase MutT (NUDIX family)